MAASVRRVCSVFVARVPWTLSNKELKEYFTQFGRVTKCELLYDKQSGFHKGYGWVTFSSADSIEKTLQSSPHILEGSKLDIKLTEEQ